MKWNSVTVALVLVLVLAGAGTALAKGAVYVEPPPQSGVNTSDANSAWWIGPFYVDVIELIALNQTGEVKVVFDTGDWVVATDYSNHVATIASASLSSNAPMYVLVDENYWYNVKTVY